MFLGIFACFNEPDTSTCRITNRSPQNGHLRGVWVGDRWPVTWYILYHNVCFWGACDADAWCHLWTPLFLTQYPSVIYPFSGTLQQQKFRIQTVVGTRRSHPTVSLLFPPQFLLDLQKLLRHVMESRMFRRRLSGLQESRFLHCWVGSSHISRVIDYFSCQ